MSDVPTLEEVYNFFYNKGFTCGCGEPEKVVEFVRDMLRALKMSTSTPGNDLDSNFDKGIALMSQLVMLETHPGIGWMLMSLIEHAGLSEHGTNVRCSWLTDQGLKMLEALEQFTPEQVIDYGIGPSVFDEDPPTSLSSRGVV